MLNVQDLLRQRPLLAVSAWPHGRNELAGCVRDRHAARPWSDMHRQQQSTARFSPTCHDHDIPFGHLHQRKIHVVIGVPPRLVRQAGHAGHQHVPPFPLAAAGARAAAARAREDPKPHRGVGVQEGDRDAVAGLQQDAGVHAGLGHERAHDHLAGGIGTGHLDNLLLLVGLELPVDQQSHSSRIIHDELGAERAGGACATSASRLELAEPTERTGVDAPPPGRADTASTGRNGVSAGRNCHLRTKWIK
mmetsp:Transcript_28344/g.84541  ORF Transcript_28344/g.84541 Transcript_28344/m.84541 type:complete len:248 (-) Transcript_28344:719-1462(-)